MSEKLKSCRVLVTPTTFGAHDSRLRSKLQAAVGEVVYNDRGRPLSSAELRNLLPGVDGYIAGLDTIDRQALESADRLKVVAQYGVGVDNVDLEAAARKSIVVTNTPKANSASVAELTFGLILALARQIPQISSEVREGNWPRRWGIALAGKTIGILGFGSVGKEVAQRLQGWGCRVVAYDTLPDHQAAKKLGVELVSTDEVVRQADFLTIHVPAAPDTRGLVDTAFLQKMKPGSFLINTARGEIVNESDIAEALRHGRLRGAALDTLSQEPPPASSELLKLPQVIITPHCGAHTDAASGAMGWQAVQDCLAVLRGEEPAHPVIAKNSGRNYQIKTQAQPTMYFIGVTTGQSAIMKVFPLWMKELGRPEVRLEGVDLKIHDRPENYRTAVAQIKYDPLSLGALVTTHKIDLLAATGTMFDYLDPFARICGEISSISKNGAALEGHAKDPITAGMSLDSLLGEAYFGRTAGEVLCFGAGGSATAIILHLARKPLRGDRPRRLIIVNRSPGRLESLKAMVKSLGTDIEFVYRCNSRPEVNAKLMEKLPPGSLVINATGMGKDTPGSPIPDDALFPTHGVVWELNYRGELDFLHQALRQAQAHQLTVEDGWLYFLHGWTQVIAQVLKVEMEGPKFEKLAQISVAMCMPALLQRVVPTTGGHIVHGRRVERRTDEPSLFYAKD